MTNGNDLTNKVWEKYDEYLNNGIKDEFFKKHLYRNTDYIRAVQTVMSLVMIIVATMGISYAGTIVYKEIIQKSSQVNTVNEINYNEFYGDFTVQSGRLYKKVYSYNDYLSLKERFGDIVEMTEEDFTENFMILIVFERYEDSGVYVNQVISDDNTLYVELKKYKDKENIDINNNILSIQLNKAEDRENIKIELLYDDIKPQSDNYKDLSEIPIDYTIAQAIEDNCFVVENYVILSNDVNQLDNFIENTQKGNNDFIRILESSPNGIIIKDIEYRNGEYIICIDETRFNHYRDEIYDVPEFLIFYKSGYQIKTSQAKYTAEGEPYAKRYKLILNNERENPNNSEYYVLCTIKY